MGDTSVCFAPMLGGILGAMAMAVVTNLPSPPASERLLFNDGWRFTKGDSTDTGGLLKYDHIKPWLLDSTKPDAPEGGTYAQPGFDDQSWQSVRLPHDWGISGPFKTEYPGETGKLPWWGIGWYRKHFTVPSTDAGRKLYLDIDGAMSYSTVWLNGHLVGGRPYGYSSYRVDLTPFVKAGADNLVAVRLDNPEESSRWYPGGGLYRNVWLVTSPAVHVAHWGVTVTNQTVTKESASVRLQVQVENSTNLPQEVTATTDIYRGRKKVATSTTESGSASANGYGQLELKATIDKPQLWSPTKPNLYRAVTTVRQGSKVIDVAETPFGVRSIEFNSKVGFLLNGKKTFLKGVCLHHDLGAIGAAFNMRAAERQLQTMQAMGFNALRTSHNPPAPEMLDLCDRMGILVMDEFSDTWTRAKKDNGYAMLFNDWHEADLRGMIRRDRNHPCVVMWSIGNEIGEQGDAAGHEIAKMLTKIVHEEDPTRPSTSGNDHLEAGFNGYQKTIDVFGYNYKPPFYQRFIKANPDIPLFGSETASTLSSRGEYFFPFGKGAFQEMSNYQVGSYDLCYPTWSTVVDREFQGQDENPTVFGEFVWTGFDYLGEPTPYGWDDPKLPPFSDPALKATAEKQLKELGHPWVPSRSSYFGIVDLAGFPKDRFYLYQARWRPELKMAHLLPHWNWPERVGQVTPVFVYTSGDEAELFLNGKSLGRKKKAPLEYRIRWNDVVYQPGELRVVAYKNGKPWATDVQKTTGAPAKLTIKADRNKITANGDDLSYITVTVADHDGLLVPRSHNRISFEISGPGEIVATDNGDATDLESFQATNKKAFNGLCLVVVRTKRGEKGTITVQATSAGLEPTEAVLESR